LNLQQLLTWLRIAMCSSRVCILANHNLHSIALHHRDAAMRAFYDCADLTVVDGRPLIAWARILGLPLHRQHKLSWLDHLDDLLAVATMEGWTVAHLGCRPGVAERAAERLRQRHSGLRLVTHHGFFAFPGPENDAVLEWLQAIRPRLLLVGMGMPRQEHWLLHARDRLPPCVAVTCGATFDYLAGTLPTPPRWLSPLGLEWAFRLASEPRRLAHRYLIEPLTLLPWLLRDLRLKARATSRTAVRPGAARAASPQTTASIPPASTCRRSGSSRSSSHAP
jgi:N-acetylglucosaminyldiphosphoundecaprenol N-acetyl-beta-D-mannosaminyltransferase